jgi:hypothetical protein
MNNYSEELKSAVMDFVKDERNEEENQNFIPNEVALPKKNFLTEVKIINQIGWTKIIF